MTPNLTRLDGWVCNWFRALNEAHRIDAARARSMQAHPSTQPLDATDNELAILRRIQACTVCDDPDNGCDECGHTGRENERIVRKRLG